MPQPPMVRPTGTTASLLLVRVEDPGPDGSLDQQKLGVLRGRPVDPRTLEDIPGFTPLELGHHYRTALSPDGRTLATMVWPSGSTNAGGVLHLVDPISWNDRLTEVRIEQTATWLEWSADGTRLFWMQHIGRLGANLTQYAIFSTDVARPAAREVVVLPAGFEPYDTRLLGSRIVLLGAMNERSLAQEDAAIAFVDLAAGKVSSMLRLDGFRLGQFEVSEPGLYPYRMILPGVAWDLARDRLVVVDAERDLIRIIDLARGTDSGPLAVRTRAAAKGPGGAKMVSMTRKDAILSEDGRWLYVSGLREDVAAAGGDAHVTPLALQRIDLTNVSETARVEGGQGLGLSADGTRLVIPGEALRVLDSSDLRELARVDMFPGTALAGQRDGVIYVAHASYPGPSTLRSIDLTAGDILATRAVARGVAQLILLR